MWQFIITVTLSLFLTACASNAQVNYAESSLSSPSPAITKTSLNTSTSIIMPTETQTPIPPTETPLPSITPIPSITYTPTITPTPVPDYLLLGQMTIQIGDERCGNFIQRGDELGRILFTEEKGIYGRGASPGYYYYSLEYTFTKQSPHIQLEKDGDEHCVSVDEDSPPGIYYVLYSVKVYEEKSSETNPATREFLTENIGYFRIRALPPADTAEGNDLIAFVDRDEIYIMNVDGTGLSNLGVGVRPKWSPDGRKIIFESYSLEEGIYVASLDGEEVIKLTDEGSEPTWSPDGRLIAFFKQGGIWVMNADGTGQPNLVAMASNYSPIGLSWSPDSKRIGFITIEELGVVDLNANILFTIAEPYYSQIEWSPIGENIAFLRGFNELYLINSDGSNIRNISPGLRNVHCFSWSNDGQKIALLDTGLYTINSDGSGLIQLVEDTVTGCPTWSPNDGRIAFIKEQALNIYAQDVHWNCILWIPTAQT